MNPEDTKTDIEMLAGKADPAWMWDFERGRIVWANRAGIVFWDEDTLFDLLDHRFDTGGATVKKIREIAEKLDSSEGKQDEVIFFPEAGQLVKCTCCLSPLEGGRNGLLLAAKRAEGKGQEAGGELFAQVVNNSPFALGVFDRAGRLIYANGALGDIFGTVDAETGENQKMSFKLGKWLGSQDDAHALVSRILLVGSHSEARRMHTRFGPRTHRVTARRLSLDKGETALLIYFHDIEDRRRYELKLETRLAELESRNREISEPLETDKPQSLAASTPVETREDSGVDNDTIATGTKAGTIARLVSDLSPKVPEGRESEEEASSGEACSGETVPEISLETIELTSIPDLADTPLTDLLKKAESVVDQAKVHTLAAKDEVISEVDDPKTSPVVHEKTDQSHLEGKDKAAFSAIAQALRANNPLVQEKLDLKHKSQEMKLVDVPEGEDAAPAMPEPAPETKAKQDEKDQKPVPAAQPEKAEKAKKVKKRKNKEKRKNKKIELIDVSTDKDAADTGQGVEVKKKDQSLEPALTAEPGKVQSVELEKSRAQISKLQAILDSAADGIVTLDGEGRICNLNTAAEAIIDIKADDVRGEKFTSLLSKSSVSDVQNYLEAVSEQGVAGLFRDGCEIEAVGANKKVVPLFLTIGPVKSDDTLQYCAVIRDVSQWKRAEAGLREAKERAEEDSEKKSDFLARISHELRTPLNAIIGFSEVMSEEKFGPIANDRYKGYVSDIRTSSEHLLSLINDLLDITKIESGKLDLDFTSVELGEIITQSVSIMQLQATRERIVIRSSLPDNLPPIVADFRSMRQIVLNLLSNAIKFTKSGGQVIVSVLHNETGEVVLRVRDTGIGMTGDELKKAMEPYRQIKSVHETDQPGTGLGLPLTRALAEANRAEFKIESAKDKGTLVQITFPTTRVLAE